jgi:hypothetical protein
MGHALHVQLYTNVCTVIVHHIAYNAYLVIILMVVSVQIVKLFPTHIV